MPYTSMTLNGLELSVNLGWPSGERRKPQIVIADITLRFATPPKGCATDCLDDTHCYDALITLIKEQLATRHFRLLEHLGCELHALIKQALPATTRVTIRTTKKPAILNLTGGVSFFYGDEE